MPLACYKSGCVSPQDSTLLKLLVTSTVLGVSLGCNIDCVLQYSDTLLEWVHGGLNFERDMYIWTAQHVMSTALVLRAENEGVIDRGLLARQLPCTLAV